MMVPITALLSLLLSGCVGLDPKNEGFAENAAEVGERVFVGIMTLGISEGFVAQERKAARLREQREARYQRWYEGLSDTEKNIEDMREAHRYQLMGTIMHGRQLPTLQPYQAQPYAPMHSITEGTIQTRQRTNCTSQLLGNQVNTTCY